jgi:bacterial surface protein 26-residue repeat
MKRYKKVQNISLLVLLIFNIMINQGKIFANELTTLEIEAINEETNPYTTILHNGVYGTSPWRIENDGTLYIEGRQFDSSTTYGSPWSAYRHAITKIVFENDVVAFGDQQFLFGTLNKVTMIEGLEKLDTSNVTDMSYMFAYTYNLTELDVIEFDTSKVTDMCWMFSGSNSLTKLDVTGFDTSKVTNMNLMFAYTYNLTKLDVTRFDTSKVTDMGGMFMYTHSLTELDVTGFDTSNVTDMS